MSNDQIQLSASDLLNKLSDKGYLDKTDETIRQVILDNRHDSELPLYIRVLVGVGAFIASLCFIGLVAVGLSVSDEQGFIVSGLIFAGLALALQKLGAEGGTIKGNFFLQTSFAFMATGKIQFTFGMGAAMESGWGATIALLMITLATYHVYRMSVDRFLSSFAVFFSILMNILWEKDVAGMRELLLNGFVFIQLLCASIIIVNVKISRNYVPLLYGLLFSLCASTLFLASHANFGYWNDKESIDTLFVTLLFTASLMAAIYWVVGNTQKLKTEPMIMAFIGAALFGVLSAPGVILAMILMILGYARHEKIMVVLGALLVPVFLFLYYYNLDVSLLTKSGVLIGSGVALLVGRFYIGLKGWSKGEAS